jgi:hypothetical protein
MSSQGSVGGVGSQRFKIDKGSPLWKYITRIDQCAGGEGIYGNAIFAKTNIEALITGLNII